MTRQLKTSEVAGVLKQLVERQGRRCAVCGELFTVRDNAVLDHCHTTGFIRGALHRSCNGAEGKVKTKAYLGHKGVSPEAFLIGLGKYLEHHTKPVYNILHPSYMSEEQKRTLRNKKAREARANKEK